VSIAFYVSGHGFGHASRDIEVLNALLDRRPDLDVTVRTPAERWLFDLTLRHPVRIERVETDTGVVQHDSLHLDEAGTLLRAAAFYDSFEARAEREAAVLREAGTNLVVADIPPLACRAAQLAGIPAIALGNFTWDWIYEGYPDHHVAAPGVVPAIARAYAAATLALRLPMHGGFASMPCVRDIPFVARKSRRDPREVREALGLARETAKQTFPRSREDAKHVLPRSRETREHRPLVLLSFGGHGLDGLDTRCLDTGDRYTLITTGEIGLDPTRRAAGFDMTDARPGARARPLARQNDAVVEIDERTLYDRGFRYEDLVAAADAVVTKPGYGIITECLANDTAMLYTSRGRFAEYPVLVAALPRFLRSHFISQDDLYAGSWRTHLDALLAQPAPPEHPDTNGAEVAADAILGMAHGGS